MIYEKFFTYTLTDPRTNSVFYVGKGKTRGGLAYRPKEHITIAKRNADTNIQKQKLIQDILNDNLSIKIDIISWHDSDLDCLKAELELYNSFPIGQLMNIVPCGVKGHQKNHSEATRIKFSQNMKKKWQDPIFRKQRSIELTGRKMTIESRLKMSESGKKAWIKRKQKVA